MTPALIRPESVILHGVGAVDIGGSAAANDTLLVAVRIYANGGGAVTATITGLPPDEGGNAVSRVLTGSTTLDLTFEFYGTLNKKAKLAITASVADKVEVFYKKAYPG